MAQLIALWMLIGTAVLAYVGYCAFVAYCDLGEVDYRLGEIEKRLDALEHKQP